MVTIIPAILATSEEQFSKELNHLKSSSALAEGWVHIDFMDGEFVETKSIDPEILEKFEIPFHKEAHLMVKNPLGWIPKLKKQGFERVIIHLEAEQVEQTLNLIKESGMETGLAINPETEFSGVEDFTKNLDVLQIMAIHPGKQGQDFLPSTYNKVKDAVTIFGTIEVDGGVNDQTAQRLVEAGAGRLVVGSYLQEGDIDESFETIWETLR